MRKHASLPGAVLMGFLSVLSYAQAPVPFVNQPLIPDATAPGGPQFTLTVNGTGFVLNSVVNWNGNALVTQFVSDSQLTATVPALDIATASTGWITVVNPAPGGGTSNTVFFAVTATSGESVEFAPASTLMVGPLRSLATGNVNGDGKLDLVVPNWIYSGAVSILLGDGTGNFTSASYPVGGHYPSVVAVGDFNGDGKLDLVVACSFIAPSSVFILLGDGNGGFTQVSSSVVGDTPESTAVGDFNGDGNLDLAVANRFSGSLSILLGDGTGNFSSASSPATGASPSSVAAGDFNGDGKLDLAVTNSGDNTVSILLGDSTGNFSLASSPATGGLPSSVAVGDFNRDGKLDLATANVLSGTVSVLLGDGAGNFTLAWSPSAGFEPVSLALGDFNGDGELDLAVADADQYYGNTVSILWGDGTGNFTMGSPFAVGRRPLAIVVGDFNGDGHLDLATANLDDSTVSILLAIPHGPVVTLLPTGLTFGTQLAGTTSSRQYVTLSNTGDETLTITTIAASANFSQTNNCGAAVSAGASCTITVIFRPHAIGTLTGTVTITDNATTSPQSVSLNGVGSVVTLLPSSLNFGNQTVGTTSPPLTATLTNYSRQAVSVRAVRLSGNNPGGFAQINTCGTSVPAGASCTISVSFTPKGKGAKSATLDVVDNGGGSPQTVNLSGTGTQE